jgi:hypothetical protein
VRAQGSKTMEEMPKDPLVAVRRLLEMARGRLKRLQELNAPRQIIENEKALIARRKAEVDKLERKQVN